MANTPTQHCVHPGRHASQSPLRREASARAASTIWISSRSPAGNMGSRKAESTVWVAPKRRAHSSLRSSMSTATIMRAPARAERRDGGVAHPAAAEHRHRVAAAHSAGVDRGAEAGHDPAPDQAGRLRPGRRIHLDGLAGGHQRLLGEGADAERRRERRCRPSGSSAGRRWRCRSSTRAGPAGTSGTSRTGARQASTT